MSEPRIELQDDGHYLLLGELNQKKIENLYESRGSAYKSTKQNEIQMIEYYSKALAACPPCFAHPTNR